MVSFRGVFGSLFILLYLEQSRSCYAKQLISIVNDLGGRFDKLSNVLSTLKLPSRLASM